MIKFLFICAQPINSNPLHINKEFRDIDKTLRASLGRNHFELKFKGASRLTDLRSDLLYYKPDIVHFSGHGSSNSIFLEDNQGFSKEANQETLLALFKTIKNVKLIFINSCYSRNLAPVLSKICINFIGVSTAVPDSIAIDFSVGFYDAIFNGVSIKDSFDIGFTSVKNNNQALVKAIRYRSLDLDSSDTSHFSLYIYHEKKDANLLLDLIHDSKKTPYFIYIFFILFLCLVSYYLLLHPEF